MICVSAVSGKRPVPSIFQLAGSVVCVLFVLKLGVSVHSPRDGMAYHPSATLSCYPQVEGFVYNELVAVYYWHCS